MWDKMFALVYTDFFFLSGKLVHIFGLCYFIHDSYCVVFFFFLIIPAFGVSKKGLLCVIKNRHLLCIFFISPEYLLYNRYPVSYQFKMVSESN